MIVSHQFQFVFVKTLKTAGTSIEVFLSPLCGDADVFTPIWPKETGHRPRNHEGFYNHMPAAEIRDKLGAEIWDGYGTFAVERNPWDKLISHYAMERQRHRGHLDFDTYFANQELLSFRSLYTDPVTGELLVDRVLRYEKLDQELGSLLEQLGIPWPGTLTVRAKSGVRNHDRHYREYYSDAQREKVARACEWEIERFGYEF